MKPSLRDWLLLAVLFACLVLVIGAWVIVDRRPPEWDYANHLERAARCHQILSEQGWRGAGTILEMSSFYPPVVPCAAALGYFLFPITSLTSQAVMLGFLGLALVSLFLVGCRLFDGPTGLLAALLFGSAPFVLYSGTKFQLDLPLAAIAIFALFILVKTDDFSRRTWSLAMGPALALGMLVKPPFAVYLLAPLALVIARAFRAHDRGRRGLNLVSAFVLGSLLSLPWYGPRLFGLPMQIANRSFKQAAQSGYPETLTVSSLLLYPRALLPMFGLVAALLFAWGLLALAREPGARSLLWAASLVPFGVFLFIRNKDLRYVLPILPVAALIGAAGLRALGPAWRRGLVAVAIVASVLQIGISAFGVPPAPAWTPRGVSLFFSFPPSRAEWPNRQILDLITREAAGTPVTVSVVPNDNYFSAANFRYYAVRDRLPLTVTRPWDEYPLGVDFIVLKTGSQGPDFSIAKARRIMDRLAAGDSPFERVFPVIWQGPLPDGSAAIVRQRRLTAVTGVSPAALARQLRQGIARFLEPYARELEGLRVDLVYSSDALLKGEIHRVVVAARSARIAEFSRKGAVLRVAELRLALERVVFNPHRLVSSGDVEPLAIESFRVEHLVITEEDLQAFLNALRGLRGLSLGLEEGVVSVMLKLPGPDVAARLRLSAGDETGPLTLRAERLSLGGVPLPAFLARWVLRHFDPGPRLAALPVTLGLGEIRVEPGRIVIGSPERGGGHG